MENPIKMDDLGVPLFLETSIYLTPGFCCYMCSPLGVTRVIPLLNHHLG